MNNDKPYFANLDAIRWIAALMVFLGHAVSPAYPYLHIQGSVVEAMLYGISDGKAGVSIFFVLSGFLITYLLIAEHQQRGHISLKKFYIRRVLRIWPLYYVVVFFSFFLYPLLNSLVHMEYPWGSNIYYHLSFLSNFDIIRMSHLFHSGARSQDITWSVSIEEQFYLVWPLLFVLLRPRFWGYAILLTLAGSLVFRYVNADNGIVLYFHSLAVMLDLAIGALFAYAIQTNPSVRRFFENRSTGTHLLLFALIIAYLTWSALPISAHYTHPFVRVFSSALFGCMIASQALTRQSSWLNLDNWTFARNWGTYTYGIYLLHPMVMVLVEMTLFAMGITLNGFLALLSVGLLELLLTLAFSKFMYTYYESYFLKFKTRFR